MGLQVVIAVAYFLKVRTLYPLPQNKKGNIEISHTHTHVYYVEVEYDWPIYSASTLGAGCQQAHTIHAFYIHNTHTYYVHVTYDEECFEVVLPKDS